MLCIKFEELIIRPLEEKTDSIEYLMMECINWNKSALFKTQQCGQQRD